MEANHQPDVHLVTRDDHANQWRSTNLNQKENMPQYGIRCVIGQKNQMASSHLSSEVRSSSSESITESDPRLKKTHLKRGSMMTSKCWKVRVRMNDSRKAPLEDHDKITNRSSSRRVSRRRRWSCDSMKIYNSQPKQKYGPIWHRCMVERKSGDMKSSIITCVISVTQNEPKRQGNVSQNKKHDGIQMSNMMTGWLKRGSTKG